MMGNVFVILATLVVYFTPTIIAFNKPWGDTVFWINLLFGWTLIGWFISFAMSLVVFDEENIA